MILRHKFLCIGNLLLAVGNASTAVELAPVFTSGAVIQRDEPVTVWGSGRDEVKSAVGVGQAVTAVVSPDGKRLNIQLPSGDSDPQAVRYAWRNFCQLVIFSNERLPVSPCSLIHVITVTQNLKNCRQSQIYSKSGNATNVPA